VTEKKGGLVREGGGRLKKNRDQQTRKGVEGTAWIVGNISRLKKGGWSVDSKIVLLPKQRGKIKEKISVLQKDNSGGKGKGKITSFW